MTPERFREILDFLDWSQGDVARLMKRDPRAIRRMISGVYDIDPEMAEWLEFQAANPPPERKPRPVDTSDFSR